jgi:hypothetical protein
MVGSTQVVPLVTTTQGTRHDVIGGSGTPSTAQLAHPPITLQHQQAHAPVLVHRVRIANRISTTTNRMTHISVVIGQ